MVLRVYWLILGWLTLAALHMPVQAQTFDRLNDQSPQPVLAAPLEWLSMPATTGGLPGAFVAGTQAWPFQAYTPSTVLPTTENQDAWARFTLAATSKPQVWFVRMARVGINRISVFTQDAQTGWSVQSAGTLIAPAHWALRTRTPAFELQSATTERTYYIRFEHHSPLTERPMLLTAVNYMEGASFMSTLTGGVFGISALLLVMCLAATALGRNTLFIWLGVWVLALLLTQLIWLGFGGWRLWPHSAYVNVVMTWVAPLLSVAAGSWFCAQASYARDSHRWLYWLLAGVALGCLLVAGLVGAFFNILPRSLLNAWAAFSVAAILGSLGWLAYRGQRWNLWLLGGCLLISTAAIVRLAFNYGLVAHLETAQTIGIFLVYVGMLWLLLALIWRSREALVEQERSAIVTSHDADTGLALPQVAMLRLPKMLVRANRFSSGCGVLLLRWQAAESLSGLAHTQQRAAVLKRLGTILRRAIREVDTAVRYENDHFLILVEGPVSRDALTVLSSRILAACMHAAINAKTPDAFNQYVAIWQGAASKSTADEVVELLKTRLNQMSQGTQRRVQFVDSADSVLSFNPEQTAAQRKAELLGKIDAVHAAVRQDLPTEPAKL